MFMLVRAESMQGQSRAEQSIPVPGQVVSEADNNLLVSEPPTFGMVNGNLETILLY